VLLTFAKAAFDLRETDYRKQVLDLYLKMVSFFGYRTKTQE
jgi:hypothetical protein